MAMPNSETGAVRGGLFVISGPSGVGKGTVVTKLLESDFGFVRSRSMTTRPRRPLDPNDVKYSFCDRETFMQMVVGGQILEYTEYGGNLYGTITSLLDEDIKAGKNILLELDVNGAVAIKEKFPTAVTVCLLPESFEELVRRLRGRGTESEDVISVRLNEARREITHFYDFDYIVINRSGKVDEAAQAVLDIARLDSMRSCRMGDFYSDYIKSICESDAEGQLSIKE